MSRFNEWVRRTTEAERRRYLKSQPEPSHDNIHWRLSVRWTRRQMPEHYPPGMAYWWEIGGLPRVRPHEPLRTE